MKPGIHPNYRYVVFQDTSSGDKFLTRSTIASNETVVWDDGNEYPLAKVEISAFTHPFFTGKQKLVDTGGRVERFNKRSHLLCGVGLELGGGVERFDAVPMNVRPTMLTRHMPH